MQVLYDNIEFKVNFNVVNLSWFRDKHVDEHENGLLRTYSTRKARIPDSENGLLHYKNLLLHYKIIIYVCSITFYFCIFIFMNEYLNI